VTAIMPRFVSATQVARRQRQLHLRIAINRLAGTLNSAATFSIAATSLGASTAPSHTALLAIL
jgi:hypothetical protein